MSTLWHNGQAIVVYEEVLEQLGLRNHQHIDTNVFWKVIGLNASTGLAKIAIEKAKTA